MRSGATLSPRWPAWPSSRWEFRSICGCAGGASVSRDALPQLALVGNGLIRKDADLERQRFKTFQPDFDAMRSGLQVQFLEGAVVVVHGTGEITVHEHFRLAWFHLQLEFAVVVITGCGCRIRVAP